MRKSILRVVMVSIWFPVAWIGILPLLCLIEGDFYKQVKGIREFIASLWKGEGYLD